MTCRNNPTFPIDIRLGSCIVTYMTPTETPEAPRPTMHPWVRQMRMRRVNDHMMWMHAGRAESTAN